MKKILLVLLSLILTACATPYQPFELFGRGGYQDKQISGDTFQVAYYGNGVTNMQTMNSLLLYRTAEIAATKNFSYFEVLSSSGRIPMSAFGGFKNVQHTVRMYKDQPTVVTARIFSVSKVKEEYGPYVGQQK